MSKTDPEAAIARLKDGTTHLAYKAEHVVDLESDIILAATITPANHGDTQTMVDSVMQAQVNLNAVGCEQRIEEVRPTKVIIRRQIWNCVFARFTHLHSRTKTQTNLPLPAAMQMPH